VSDTVNEEGLPIIMPIPEPKPMPADGAIAICGLCGLRIKAVMHYSCSYPRCPIFVKVTCHDHP
jgi:hypothetical protein